MFKPYGTIVELSESEVVEFIDSSGKENFVRLRFPIFAIFKEVCVDLGVDAFKQTVNQFVVSSDGYTLVFVVEIIIVVGQSDR